MVTLKFVFNKEKIKSAGLTEEELLRPMRGYAAKVGIKEVEHGVFEKDGEDAFGQILNIIPELNENRQYITFFDEWTLDVDGEKENVIEETLSWFRKQEEV